MGRSSGDKGNRGDRVAAGKKISAALKDSQKCKDAAILNAKRASDRLIEYLKENKPNITQIGEYVCAKTKIEFHCSLHDINFMEVPNYLRNGAYGCKECSKEGIKRNNVSSRPDVIEKTKKTKHSRTPEQIQASIDKTAASRIQSSVSHLDDIKREQYFSRDWMYDFHVNQKNNINEMAIYFNVKRDVIFGQLDRHHIIVESHAVSQGEKEIAYYIESLGLTVDKNNRTLIKPKELDIYIPSHKLAIEYHGCHWHSDKYHGRSYHKNKLQSCKMSGIQLIQIWEDDWIERQEVCKKFIRNKLGFNQSKIHARKCTIHPIDQDQYYEFLDNNHMQGGHATASIRFGMFNDDVLVAVMGFKRVASNVLKYGQGVGYELCRFSSVGVRGAFSKLVSTFNKNYQHDYLISFGDLEIVDQNKNVYLTNGFEEIDVIDPDYSYFIQRRREHKFTWRKSEFERRGFDIEGKTESDLAKEAGLLKCWDSGKVCYIKRA